MKKWLLLTLFVIFIIPCLAFAKDNLSNLNFGEQTGLEFYTIIKPMGDLTKFNDPEKEVGNALTIGYLTGFIQSLAMTQNVIIQVDTSEGELSESESLDMAEKLNLKRINIPDDGIAPFQLILIYSKWAQNNPKYLSNDASSCLLASIIEEYGWK
jgi:hypothetical protein